MRTWTHSVILTGLAVTLLTTQVALAQNSRSGGWDFSLTPYLWAAGIDGQVTLQGNTVPVDVGFDELFDNLETALTLHFEASKRSWGLFLDTSYIKLESEFESVLRPGPVPGARVGGLAALDYALVEAAVFRRWGNERGGWDVLFGLRYWDFEQNVTRILVPGLELSGGGSRSWTDLMVGFRYNASPSDRWLIRVRYDIAGLGSELTWNTSLIFHYFFPKLVSLAFGYRYLDLDYTDGSGGELFAMDLAMDGPVLGIGFRF